jgi:hypothetical protein
MKSPTQAWHLDVVIDFLDSAEIKDDLQSKKQEPKSMAAVADGYYSTHECCHLAIFPLSLSV